MQCSGNEERNQAYTLTWQHDGTILETDTGTTPNSVDEPFFETFTIPSDVSYTNANATLTGTFLEGIDYFNVSGNSSNLLRINNLKFSPTALMGNIFAVDFEVMDIENKTIDNAHCTVYGTDENDAPLQECGESHTHNGRGTCSGILDSDTFIEEDNYIAKIRCSCNFGDNSCFNEDGTQIEGYHGSVNIPFVVSKWLNVSTLTDQLNYTLDDDYVYVCANVSNNNNERITLEIVYNYRCGIPDSATDRVLIAEHTEIRGISSNTTQNQCAALEIINVDSIQNKISTCYGATDVRILRKDGSLKFSYTTISPIFNIQSDSTVLEGDTNMTGASILIIGFLFFIAYLMTKIDTKDKDNNVVPMKSMIVMILIVIAGFTAFMTIQIATGIVLAYGLDARIASGVLGIFRIVSAASILLLFIVFFGILINVCWSAIEWISGYLNKR